MMIVIVAALFLVASTGVASAGNAVVEKVVARQAGDGTWRFDVTVRHTDEGWDHYANAFVVETLEGAELGTRVLLHPHVNEQPFTRSLNGVAVPAEARAVNVRAVDSVHGPGEAVRYDLPR